jgi:hypothetical protein
MVLTESGCDYDVANQTSGNHEVLQVEQHELLTKRDGERANVTNESP